MLKAICLILGLLLPAQVFAADAHQLFETGVQALGAGNAGQALTAFEAAYKAQPAPSLLFWIGEAHRGLGHKERAAKYYRQYLDQLPDGPKSAEAKARLAELKKGRPENRQLSLEEIDLTGPAGPAPDAGTSPGPGKAAKRKKKSSKKSSRSTAEQPAVPPLVMPLPGPPPAPEKSAAALPALPAAPPPPLPVAPPVAPVV